MLQKRCMFLPMHPARWYTFLICPITDAINFQHFMKLVSARFLYCKIIIIFSVANNKLLKLCTLLHSHHTFN